MSSVVGDIIITGDSVRRHHRSVTLDAGVSAAGGNIFSVGLLRAQETYRSWIYCAVVRDIVLNRAHRSLNRNVFTEAIGTQIRYTLFVSPHIKEVLF